MTMVAISAALVSARERSGPWDLRCALHPVTLMTRWTCLARGRRFTVRTMTIQALVHNGT